MIDYTEIFIFISLVAWLIFIILRLNEINKKIETLNSNLELIKEIREARQDNDDNNQR
jgi:hypothetical protein